MKHVVEKAPPAFASLDEILLDFRQSDSPTQARPAGKVTVKKKGAALEGLRKLFAKKPEDKNRPNCESAKNVSVSGTLEKSVSIDCSGCGNSSDLADPECRMRCAKIVGREGCARLVLDDGLCKRSYGEIDAKKLSELYEIAEGMQVAFPEECGLCAVEHQKQVEAVRAMALKDPIRLLKSGIEVEDEDPGISVKGVAREICAGCREQAEAAVNSSLSRLAKSRMVRDSSFAPLVSPFFSNSRILFELPERNKIEEAYESCGAKVVLSRGEEEMYSVFPREYGFGRKRLKVMKMAYAEVVKKPCEDERQFSSLCRSEVANAASRLGCSFQEHELAAMAEDLARCTMGLDVIELLLKDPNLQDVYVNSPIDATPLYVKHRDFDDCRTNVYLTEQAARNMISKFRLKSGRAFSEVSPILDMELPEFGVRVNITGPPVSPDGLAFAFRRASEEPWTLLRFIENRMISPLAAGLLGTVVNEESTILMCGDRGSGKTSMLTALMSAMPIKYRILTLEDTFELPVPALAREGGFRIQRMRVKPPTATDSAELSADDAMRSLLRMGDSAIVMGEVRGKEAKTLYEAMNVGGSGNCVLGTIHGKSPRSLLERVIFSLGIPPQSFKATDLVVIADRIRPGGGSRRLRRVSEIAEVRKDWEEPDAEKVFAGLMGYDRSVDELLPSPAMKDPRKSQVICKIANKRGVKPSVIMRDVEARADAYRHAVALYNKTKNPKLLSMKAIVGLNHKYLQLVDESIRDFGKADYGFVAAEAKGWISDLAKGKAGIPANGGKTS